VRHRRFCAAHLATKGDADVLAELLDAPAFARLLLYLGESADAVATELQSSCTYAVGRINPIRCPGASCCSPARRVRGLLT
jgi:hypothetical protein